MQSSSTAVPTSGRDQPSIGGFRDLIRITFVVLILLGTGLVWGQPGDVAYAVSPRVTICHRTRSTTNPYRQITIAQGGLNGHKNNHTGGVWVVTNNNGDAWGDIIPGSDSDGDLFWSDGSGVGAGLNWDSSGKAFMLTGGANKSKCGRMTAQRFYEISKAAGDSDTTIAADLEEQAANEDAGIQSKRWMDRGER